MNNATHTKEPKLSLTKWKNEPTLSQIQQDYQDAKVEADKHVADVDGWLDSLHLTGSAKLPPQKNKSSIQPKTIRKNNEWRYPSLEEPFLSTPDVFNVYPKGHLDKHSAYQNQLVLNHQFNNQMDKVALINEYVRTAVDEGTVITRVGWDYEEEIIEVEHPVFEFVPSQNPQWVQELQQLSQIAQQAPEQFQQLPPHIQQAVQLSIQNSLPIEPVQTGVEVVEEVKVLKNQPTVDVCDYHNVIIDPTCEGDLNKAKFIIYKFVTCYQDLKADGKYHNLDRIKLNSKDIISDEDYLAKDNAAFNFEDEPRRKFMAFEYWGYWDIHETGKPVPFVATWVGGTLIRMEESPFPFNWLPFDVTPLLPVKKSLYGEPDAELIEDNQKIIGAVTRGMIDIMAANAAGQKGARKDALDVTNKRKYMRGEDYEYNQNVDPRQAFYTQPFAEIPQSAQFMLQTQSLEAESMSGVKAFQGGISGQALGDTATGVRGALDASSKRELSVLRRLANGMVKIGRKIIAMNAEFLSDQEIVRITDDENIVINREELAGEFDLRLSISTAEEDNAKAQELAFMLQTMGNNMDAGMSQMILADIARLRKMPELAKRIQDYEPQPDPIQQALAEAEVALKQAEIAEINARAQELQTQAQLNLAKAQEAQTKADLNDLDFIEQESGVKQERDLQKQGEQARANMELEAVKAQLNPKSSPTKE